MLVLRLVLLLFAGIALGADRREPRIYFVSAPAHLSASVGFPCIQGTVTFSLLNLLEGLCLVAVSNLCHVYRLAAMWRR